MKKKYIVLLIVGAAVLILAAAGVIWFKDIQSNLDALEETAISEVDLSTIPDGVYAGSYSEFPVSAEVRVTVSGHAIKDITLVRHDTGQGQAAEAIPQMVVEAQSLQVDAVSGATYSSKVILKAIEDALINQRKG
jgi:uncharacterized protein with FMN-binding domain